MRLKREGDAWQMLGPSARAAAARPVDELLANVLTAKIDREIAAKPESLADFGLDKPAADVTLTPQGRQDARPALGAKNPTGVWVYARERDKPAVFVLGESVLRDATRPRRRLPRPDRSWRSIAKAVTGFEIVLPDETLAVESADGALAAHPAGALRADTETISEFLDKLGAPKVARVRGRRPAPRATPYGLERPGRVTIHTGRDKDRVSRTLLLGKVDAAKKGVYAMRRRRADRAAGRPRRSGTRVPKNVAVLRNKTRGAGRPRQGRAARDRGPQGRR